MTAPSPRLTAAPSGLSFSSSVPYQFTIHGDSGRQNADGTWDDTLSLTVQCSGILGKLATDVLFEIDSVVITPVMVLPILPSTFGEVEGDLGSIAWSHVYR